jgi:hypothetical protein
MLEFLVICIAVTLLLATGLLGRFLIVVLVLGSLYVLFLGAVLFGSLVYLSTHQAQQIQRIQRSPHVETGRFQNSISLSE